MKYGTGDSILPQAEKKGAMSQAWRTIHKLWAVVKQGIRWVICNGMSVNFQSDPWVDRAIILLDVAMKEVSKYERVKSVSVYINYDGSWDQVRFSEFLRTSMCLNIASIYPPLGMEKVMSQYRLFCLLESVH